MNPLFIFSLSSKSPDRQKAQTTRPPDADAGLPGSFAALLVKNFYLSLRLWSTLNLCHDRSYNTLYPAS